MIFHFVYKTTHINGRYYIGRHSTDNMDDGYLGSGVWVQGIKDKLSLNRKIICFVDNLDNLMLLEEEHILKWFDDELCMNIYPTSRGATSEIAKQNIEKRIENKTHPWQNTNNNSIRVSCLACKREINWPVYSYIHGEYCKSLIPKPIEVKLPGQGFKAGHASRAGRIGGIAGGEYAKTNKTGIHSLSKEKNMIRIFNIQIVQAVRSGKASLIENKKVTEWPSLRG